MGSNMAQGIIDIEDFNLGQGVEDTMNSILYQEAGILTWLKKAMDSDLFKELSIGRGIGALSRVKDLLS